MSTDFDPKAIEKATSHAVELQKRLAACINPLIDGGRKGKFTANQMAAHTLRMRNLREEMRAAMKVVDEAYSTLAHEITPAVFEREETKSVNVLKGYRVTITHNYFASVIPEVRTNAFKWLRSHNLGDLITETVNAKTLSATAKRMLEEENVELPPKFFNCYFEDNTSITKT